MPVKMEMKGLNELLASMRAVAPEAKREFTASLKVIGKMVDRGAALTDAEQDQVYDYLVKNFGPEASPAPEAPKS